MTDIYYKIGEPKTSTLDKILEHILIISRGDCEITDELIITQENPQVQSILSGLRILYEDLNLYKFEIKQKLEAEYKLEALKKKNEELLQFNYFASHDLQEPLSTITGFSGLLQENYPDKLDTEGKEFLSFIQSSSQRMRELINDLLDYSKISQKQDFKENDLNDIIKTVLFDFDNTITSKSAKITIDKLPVIHCSKILIHHLFQNLISNALKFIPQDRVPVINISYVQQKEDHVFCVEDNGIGIEKEHQDKIFGIFQRLHNKDKFEGTGIGLALCVRAAQDHTGELWLESEANKGSKFYFNIPKKIQFD